MATTRLLRRWMSTSQVQNRKLLWDEERKRQSQTNLIDSTEITARFPSAGLELRGLLKKVSVVSLLKESKPKLLDSAVVALVNGQPWDLTRPLETSCEVDLLNFGDNIGRDTFWHSSAHVLGAALEKIYGDRIFLCDGPAIESGGFFYEFFLEGQKEGLKEEDIKHITHIASTLTSIHSPFQRLQVNRDFALRMFADTKYKQHYINQVPEHVPISLYRCGDFIDLCRGPHIPHTGMINAFAALRASGAYWLGNNKNEQLQRVYGVAFPMKSQLANWLEKQENMRKADHRIIGRTQKLFMVHDLSPGSVFMLPHGTRICNRLMEFMRSLYHSRAYTEVITPQLYNKHLWEISGHWENYRDDMFIVQGAATNQQDYPGDGKEKETEVFGLKPMNCPGHCLIFDSDLHSYRELPVRLADFSPLHRNEISGALSGLTRVRKFMQDDAHIFCREDQMESEVLAVLQLIRDVYNVFGFNFALSLSTRPAKFIGSIETWNRAEDALRAALVATGQSFSISEGDGAFYGPKIDITVEDAMGRKHQTATVQLDFQLPERFRLRYQSADGNFQRPVIIHRAVLGSIERMLGILIEHYAGKWPFWLSPRHAYIVSLSEQSAPYAQEILNLVTSCNCYGEIASSGRLNREVREGITLGFNYVVVVGDKEAAARTVSLRHRDTGQNTVMTFDSMRQHFSQQNALPLSNNSVNS